MKDNRLEELFSHTPEIPQSLSVESVKGKINNKGVKPLAKRSIKIELIAAVFAVIIVAGIVAGRDFLVPREPLKDENYTDETITQTAKPEFAEDESLPEGAFTFDNEAQLEEYFSYIRSEIYYTFATDSDMNYAGAPESADGVADDVYLKGNSNTIAAQNSANGAVTDDSYTGTNTQNSVDEGDIIKTDGRYIYIVTGLNKAEYIRITDTETMEVVGTIRYEAEEYVKATVKEIYISGNLLTVLYNAYEFDKNIDKDYYWATVKDQKLCADIYDITDKANPQKLRTISQDGSFVTSRMLGNVLYTVTNYSEAITEENKYYLPEVNGRVADCRSVIHFDEAESTYTVITATDISDTEGKTESLNILASTSDIYCSENNLYLMKNKYTSSGNKVAVRKITLDGTKITCTASGEVAGVYNDKYSFDEHNGKLRVVTTGYDAKKFRQICYLYVLDESLKEIGRVDDITNGLDEQVKSVRFAGERAYVVTFEQTDPLFIIDLSDEKAPKVTGELFMPGYSTYLHPLSDTLLIGIGYGGDNSGADMSKLKIALFDVSDNKNPKLVDEFVIRSASTDVNYEPKALIHFPAKHIIGIPVRVYNYSVDYSETKSYAIITYGDNKLSSVEGFLHENENVNHYSYLFRGVCINDKLYTVDDLMIVEHSLTSGEKIRECQFYTAEEIEKITEGDDIVVYNSVIDEGV